MEIQASDTHRQKAQEPLKGSRPPAPSILTREPFKLRICTAMLSPERKRVDDDLFDALADEASSVIWITI